jgi:hypothetical protein
MRDTLHRILLAVAWLIGLSVIAYVAWRCAGYYRLPLTERPHAALHVIAKPGGKLGHGLGVCGAAMILLLFLYLLRKYEIVRWGNLSHWLDVHILFGVLGPLLVTLHTAFKFGGIVSVSYFSMLAVMFSGVFGRYLYVQIPRAIGGGELSEREMRERKKEMEERMRTRFGLTAEDIARMERSFSLSGDDDRSALGILGGLLLEDLIRPLRSLSVRRAIRNSFPTLDPDGVERLFGLIRRWSLLSRKIRFLGTTRRIFYYWHVLHRPFAYVMVLIMLIHVAVVTWFGYRWIF